jgi:hypothetical protein
MTIVCKILRGRRIIKETVNTTEALRNEEAGRNINAEWQWLR